MVEGRVVRQVLKGPTLLVVQYADGTSHTLHWLDRRGDPIPGRPALLSIGSLVVVSKVTSRQRLRAREVRGVGAITKAATGRTLRDIREGRSGVELTYMDGTTHHVAWVGVDGEPVDGEPVLKYEGWHIFAKPLRLRGVYRARDSGLLEPAA